MTIDEVFFAAAKRGLSVKRWGGSKLLTYNGFTHEQRVRKWQALDLAIRMGLEKPAEEFPCSVCGAEPSPSIAYHSEDYGSMLGHYPVCRSCHMKIHNRFKNPERWRQFVAASRGEEKWFGEIGCIDGNTTPTTLTTSVTKSIRLVTKEEEIVTMSSMPDKSKPSSANIREEMYTIRIAFIKAMGIKRNKMNPSPIGGYKLEHNYSKRQENLAEARRLRNIYAEMVKERGTNQKVLDMMDSNLEHRDLKAEWR
ncbi:MAG: hypothetical protein VB050_13315 [Geobacteraceae bacterium]|nr:hypothetical protein [Geobacteraceae bacterium]